MAVWIQIIGERKLNSIEDERKKITSIIDNLKIDLSFLWNTKYDSNYDPNKWKLTRWKIFELFEYPLTEKSIDSLESIRIFIGNQNFIEFSGPFDYFSQPWYFANEQNKEITKGWKKIFQEFSRLYDLSELYYFSEWFFPIEEIHSGDDSFENMKKYLENNDLKTDKLIGLEYNKFYKEKVSSC